MNRAFGNYVHYYKTNYFKYGIYRATEVGMGNNYSSIIAKTRNDLLNITDMQVKKQEASELEILYNKIFYGKGDSEGRYAKIRKTIFQTVQEELNEKYGLQAGKINMNNLDITSTKIQKELASAIGKTRQQFKKVQLEKEMTKENLLQKIQQLGQILESEDKLVTASEIKNKLSMAKRDLEAAAMSLQMSEKKIFDSNDLDYITIKKVIDNFDRIHPLYGQSGEIFEWMVPMIQEQTISITQQELKEIFKKMIHNPKIQLGDAYVIAKIMDYIPEPKDLNDNIEIATEKNMQMNIMRTRSKIDCVLTVMDDKGETHTEEVSAKNYKGRGIHIVNGTPLERILINNGDFTFATHYLNIITYGMKIGAISTKMDMETIREANKTVAGLIMNYAIKGYDKDNSASLLIVNNKKLSEIKVYSIPVLIERINQKILNGSTSAFGKFISSPSSFSDFSFMIPQGWENADDSISGSTERIQKVLARIRDVKINAKLGANMFKEYFS